MPPKSRPFVPTIAINSTAGGGIPFAGQCGLSNRIVRLTSPFGAGSQFYSAPAALVLHVQIREMRLYLYGIQLLTAKRLRLLGT